MKVGPKIDCRGKGSGGKQSPRATNKLQPARQVDTPPLQVSMQQEAEEVQEIPPWPDFHLKTDTEAGDLEATTDGPSTHQSTGGKQSVVFGAGVEEELDDFSCDNYGMQGSALTMLQAARKRAQLKFGDG